MYFGGTNIITNPLQFFCHVPTEKVKFWKKFHSKKLKFRVKGYFSGKSIDILRQWMQQKSEKRHLTHFFGCHYHDNKKFWTNYLVVKKIRESSIVLPWCLKLIYFETNTYVLNKNLNWGQNVHFTRRPNFFNGGFYVKIWCQ